MRTHDLRHTFVSLRLQQGESVVYVKEQLGHGSIQITVDTYGHLIPGANRGAVVNRFDDDDATQPSATQAQPPAYVGDSTYQKWMFRWRKVVTLNFTSWNQITRWLRRLQALKAVA